MPEPPAVSRRSAPCPGNRSGRRTLLLLAAVMLAPIIASYAAYYAFPRAAKVNYGILLPTAPVPETAGTRPDGTPFRLEDLRGRWVLLASGHGDCDAGCERKLYATRQARAMQGREQDRIVRALLVVGAAPSAGLLSRHPGLVVVRVPDRVPAGFPGGANPLYLIDPLGNFVLRYPDDPDIKGMAKDLTRLLMASRIG